MEPPANAIHRDFDAGVEAVRDAVAAHLFSLQDLHAGLQASAHFPIPFRPEAQEFDDFFVLTAVGCLFKPAATIFVNENEQGGARVSVLASGGNRSGMANAVFDGVSHRLDAGLR